MAMACILTAICQRLLKHAKLTTRNPSFESQNESYNFQHYDFRCSSSKAFFSALSFKIVFIATERASEHNGCLHELLHMRFFFLTFLCISNQIENKDFISEFLKRHFSLCTQCGNPGDFQDNFQKNDQKMNHKI